MNEWIEFLTALARSEGQITAADEAAIKRFALSLQGRPFSPLTLATVYFEYKEWRLRHAGDVEPEPTPGALGPLTARVTALEGRVAALEGAQPAPGPAPTPTPPPAPNPTPTPPPDGILLTDQWTQALEIDTPGPLDWADLSLEVQPGEVSGLRGLGGIGIDGGGDYRVWSNRSGNGKLFVESAVTSTPKNQRPALRFTGGAAWDAFALRVDPRAKLAVAEVVGANAAVAVGETNVRRQVVFAFGSSLADQEKTPEHIPPIGWRIRNVVMRASVGGKVYEARVG